MPSASIIMQNRENKLCYILFQVLKNVLTTASYCFYLDSLSDHKSNMDGIFLEERKQ